jgi:hypothetical protein
MSGRNQRVTFGVRSSEDLEPSPVSRATVFFLSLLRAISPALAQLAGKFF